ncbi:MAG: 50S ribosomal protein L4 [Chlamydiae bacterium]|nr:50S ribosomal protein L4 [Chlamydiota bacterium]
MTVIKKYNLKGDEVGQMSIEGALLEKMANAQMVKDYLVAYRANQRQWSANTKGRAEVSHSKQKPHPQKGTGRARQGCLAAPQYKGGGVVFGPKPKFDQEVKVNKKERRAVIRGLLSEKLQAHNVHVLSTEGLTEPKTKVMTSWLAKLGLQGKKVLFLGEDLHEALSSSFEETVVAAMTDLEQGKNVEGGSHPAEGAVADSYGKLVQAYEHRDAIIRSLRNIPKITFSLVPNINGYEVVLHQEIVILEGAWEQFASILEGNK